MRNLPQAQCSKEEQLYELRKHLLLRYPGVDFSCVNHVLAPIFQHVANKLGLYDAADFIQNQIGNKGGVTLYWR
jgi:hypothetical protein